MVEGHASFGGPVGWIGAAIDYSLVRYLSVMAGAGIGQSGPQLGGMLRLRVPLDTVSAGFAIGGSAGEYEDTLLSSSTSDRRRWETAYWLNNEGFFEIRTHKGINIRPYIGSGFILNRSDGKPIARDEVCVTQGTKSLGCTAPTGGQRDGNQFLFYGGVAIGYAFEL